MAARISGRLLLIIIVRLSFPVALGF